MDSCQFSEKYNFDIRELRMCWRGRQLVGIGVMKLRLCNMEICLHLGLPLKLTLRWSLGLRAHLGSGRQGGSWELTGRELLKGMPVANFVLWALELF